MQQNSSSSNDAAIAFNADGVSPPYEVADVGEATHGGDAEGAEGPCGGSPPPPNDRSRAADAGAACIRINPETDEAAASHLQDVNPAVSLHGLIRRVYQASDRAILEKVQMMASLRNLQDVIVEFTFQSHELRHPWREAIEHANRMAWEDFTPIDKMRRLSMIESAVSEEFKKSGHSGKLSADKFMPVLVYVLSQAEADYVLVPSGSTVTSSGIYFSRKPCVHPLLLLRATTSDILFLPLASLSFSILRWHNEYIVAIIPPPTHRILSSWPWHAATVHGCTLGEDVP
jgi:hypothetical protein